MKESKICNYRNINEKKKALSIVIIKTFNLHENHTSHLQQHLNICSYRKLNAQSVQYQKNRDQIDENLRHYARIVIQPEFDKVFSEISSQQDSSMLTQICYPHNIQTYEKQQKLNTSNQSNCTTNTAKNIKLELESFKDDDLQYMRIKNKDVICIQLGENQNNYFSKVINNDFSGELLNLKSSNISQIDTSKTNNNFNQYKNFTQDDNKAYTMCGRINSILDINQDLYQSMLRNYDFNIFQMSIKPQNEQYFTTSIFHIFQSFTKKHRAPYKIVSKQTKKKANSSQSSGSSESPLHQNQSVNEHQQQTEEDFKKQDYYVNDIAQESSSSSSFIDKKFQKIKKERNNTMRQSKFHNLKKSFMHALILLFQPDILNCLELSENHTQYLQSIINRMRSFSTKTRSGNGQYEYYSHTHYTALLLKLNQYSIPLITQNKSDLQLHYEMFLEDLSSSTGTDKASIKCNFYKSLIFKIIQMSINIVEKQNNLLSNIECETKSVCRFDYIIRVKSGIEKLNQGIQVTRF